MVSMVRKTLCDGLSCLTINAAVKGGDLTLTGPGLTKRLPRKTPAAAGGRARTCPKANWKMKLLGSSTRSPLSGVRSLFPVANFFCTSLDFPAGFV